MAYGCAGSSPAFRTISKGNNDAKVLFPFYIDLSGRQQSPGEVFPLRSFEVDSVRCAVFADLSGDGNIWVVHINGKKEVITAPQQS